MNTREQKKQRLVHAKNPKGFTLVELLVVIAVIGILLALLLPAVQSARESGRKTACMSNAYQLGMAVNRYDQDKGKVPCWQSEISSTPLYVSWPVSVLSYIERNDLYDSWAAGTATAGIRVNVFLCPSSPPESPASVAYGGNSGSGTNTTANGVMPPIGIPYSLEDVADGDGTATTLLFAELSGSPSQKLWTYPGGTTSQSFNTDFPVFGHTITPTSSHVNGGVVAFCDGHTYFLGNDVDPSVLTQLITSRNSGATSSLQRAVLDDSQY